MGDVNDETLVEVFRSVDPALLPLAIATLEDASIEYAVRSVDAGAPSVYGRRVGFGDVEGAAALVVRSADAARARDLLADLESASGASLGTPVQPPPVSHAPTSPGAAAPAGPREFRLTEVESGAVVGDIADEQLQFLMDELEEESAVDQDYYIDAATIDMLESAGADADLVSMLRRGLGSREGFDVGWSRR